MPERSRSIRVLARPAADGGTWLGVGVCKECQPGVEVRRTFPAGEACPQCGTPGALEWRWWPEVIPFTLERPARPTGRRRPGA